MLHRRRDAPIALVVISAARSAARLEGFVVVVVLVVVVVVVLVVISAARSAARLEVCVVVEYNKNNNNRQPQQQQQQSPTRTTTTIAHPSTTRAGIECVRDATARAGQTIRTKQRGGVCVWRAGSADRRGPRRGATWPRRSISRAEITITDLQSRPRLSFVFPFIILHLTISAQVRRAHRALALELHPDKLPAEMGAKERDEASRRFIQVQAAYDRLSAQLKA